MERDIRAGAVRLSTALFRPVRRLVGPLYRRRRSLEHDQNDDLPPLPAPWHDERWFRGGPPPRGHNRIVPLIDGEEYFRNLLAALLEARERVTIVGWCLTPPMALQRATPEGEFILADFHAYALFTGGPAIGPTGYRYEPIYVHAKVSIVDDEWFSVRTYVPARNPASRLLDLVQGATLEH
jgi:phosphatidylserine/phosphatidylglycerophosphate/cardiolipin synthase-like enzyme